ncbi:hypothetical protein AJ79_02273 [Helicocarpus griseus UAMH5409]|uniref:Uncharacterized protein n=1 Tax=Helicocarpus griseus UAMH5409 TaxID=1447875 RepID=A0A2B7Y3F4_9EURO|nr:hypothetical protein AJ79_02273 [Helicocarpus griseus UAMH5409]
MRLTLLTIVSALAASCCATGHTGRRHSHSHRQFKRNAAPLYTPIKVLTSRETGSVEARDTTQFANINPADRARMVFGKIGDGQTIQLADMTLYADPKMPIVMMEAFEGLTSAVDCNGHDGQMSLTFKSADAFKHAISSWSYINEDTDKQFLMIANHDGCAPESERQSYRITDVDNDEANNVVLLKASPANWSEVAGTFDMSFGRASVPPSTLRSLRTRDLKDWFEKIKDGFDTVIDKIKAISDDGLSKSITIPFSVGEEGATKLLFQSFIKRPSGVKISCTDCFAEAKFETTGAVKVKNFVPTTLLLEVEPQDFQSTIQLETEISQMSPGSERLNFDQAIFEAPIPGAGIVIPRIFTLGAKAAFNIQGNIATWGTGTFTSGAKSTLPDGSKISVDLIDYAKSNVTGFDNAEVKPITDFDEASFNANIQVGPQIALTLGVEVLDKTGVEAGITFGLPTITFNATSGYDENGFCSPDDTITSGVEANSAANFDIVLAVKGQVNNIQESLYETKLVNHPIATFLDECFPMEGVTPPKSSATPSGTVSPSISPVPTSSEPPQEEPGPTYVEGRYSY